MSSVVDVHQEDDEKVRDEQIRRGLGEDVSQVLVAGDVEQLEDALEIQSLIM